MTFLNSVDIVTKFPAESCEPRARNKFTKNFYQCGFLPFGKKPRLLIFVWAYSDTPSPAGRGLCYLHAKKHGVFSHSA